MKGPLYCKVLFGIKTQEIIYTEREVFIKVEKESVAKIETKWMIRYILCFGSGIIHYF